MHDAEAAYLRHLARAGETLELDGVYAVKTGLDSNTENGAVSDRPVTVDTVRRVLDWLGGIAASWIALDPRAGEALVAAGCRPESDAWQMRAQLGELPEPQYEVYDDFERWLEIHAECGWWDDLALPRRVFGALQGDDFRLYVAEDAGAASAFFLPRTVLLTSVAVLPGARRRGIGRALALERLLDAKEHGCTDALLAPSPDGGKLYDSLGFMRERQPAGHWFYCPTR